MTGTFSQNLHTETQCNAPPSRGHSPIPPANVTSTPHEGKRPPHNLLLTPAGLTDRSSADKTDSLSSPNNSRDEVDFDSPIQNNQMNKERKSSRASSSSSVKFETVV